jgi:membrane-associated protease RseP (regulator of RpoE activity)
MTDLENSFEDYLGFGTNGEIFGLRTKVDSLDIYDSTLKKVAVSYPYIEYHSDQNKVTSYDGSLGGEILRRFDIVFDFPNRKIIMKPNEYFDEGFYYNMSGLGVKKGELELYSYVNRSFFGTNTSSTSSNSEVLVKSSSSVSYQYLPKIFVDYVRENSPGDKAGIKIGDQIVSINGYKRKKLTLNRVSELFYKNPYKVLRIELKRGGKEFKVKIKNIPLVQ